MTSIDQNAHRINPATLVDTDKYGFSQIVIAPTHSRTVHISGQFSGDINGKVLGETLQEQITITFKNLKLAIEAIEAKPEHVVKIQVLIVNHSEEILGQLGAEITQLFAGHLPASTLIPVPRLALDDMLFEIDAVLEVPNG